MTKEKLASILTEHKAWLNNEPNGVMADLSGAYLSEANLRGADLIGANLSGADLRGAYLSWADLSEANLIDANLSEADLSDANLSGANGLLQACNYMDAHFERTANGYIAYKTFGSQYKPPQKWVIEPGSVIEENVNSNRTNVCGCGINVAPLECVRSQYNGEIWKVLIRWEWLAGVVVPYGTDGKIRCEKVELVEAIE